MGAKLHFFWTKNMWRNYILEFPEYCSSDVPQHHCRGSCADIESAVSTNGAHAYIDTFGDSSVINALNDLSSEELTVVLKALCESSLSIGDQMESASPVDVSFWPIHPNLERVWMIKKLSGTFKSEDWPMNDTSLASLDGSDCYGHGPNDVLPYGDIYSFSNANLTNEQLYALLDPTRDNLPYIYDDFGLDHCSYYHLDFGSWLPPSNGDEDSNSSYTGPLGLMVDDNQTAGAIYNPVEGDDSPAMGDGGDDSAETPTTAAPAENPAEAPNEQP